MSIPSTGCSKWLRTKQVAEHLGVSVMTLWRWRRDPKLHFPAGSEVNGIEFTHIDRVDEWMRERVVKRHGGKR